MPAVVKFFREKRWALVAIILGVVIGFGSAILCLAWNLVIFGFNIMYIVSPLLAGFIETSIASRKYGRSTGAISALLTFMLINGYGWFGPGIIFPKEPFTLSLITIIAIILTIQAAFPILVNYILFVVVVGTFLKITESLLNLPSRIIQRKPVETQKKEVTKQSDEIFLEGLSTPLLSVPHVNGQKIQRYIGLVAGEGIAAEKKSDGRVANLLKIIEPTPLEDMNLGEAKKVALSRMLEKAKSLGANAVEEVLIDYVSMGGLQGSVTIVTATGTAIILGDEVSEEVSIGLDEKIRVPDIDQSVTGAVENMSDESNTDNFSIGPEEYPKSSSELINGFEIMTSNNLKELEKRYLRVSRDLSTLDNRFEEDRKYSNVMWKNLKFFNKSDNLGRNMMRIKEEIMGKEVVDVNAKVIGQVKDVDITFETRTLEALVVGKGGILNAIRSSEDIIIPIHLVVAISDKILIKSEY
jgi:uncharacterized protein YbjQ (UPF0145 family)/sporulation protein YlmC with PRC-barrel domain